MKKHVNQLAQHHYKSLNTLANHTQTSANINNDLRRSPIADDEQKMLVPLPNLANHRSHSSSMASHLLSKNVSNSVADLSLSTSHSKVSSATIRLSSVQSKLDQCHFESYKKIPLSQSFDWGILAITNTDLILLYNKDKSSLVIFDAHGHENEVG
jgi:hypothetical protein